MNFFLTNYSIKKYYKKGNNNKYFNLDKNKEKKDKK